MHCTAISIDEVMLWVDSLSATTGLLPSHGLAIYAELCRFPSTAELIQEIAERESILLRFDDLENVSLMHAYAQSFISMQDGQLKARDQGAYEERNAHYKKVLTHRGFDEPFIAEFLGSLSPTGDKIPEEFEMQRRRSFDKRFNDKPFYPQRKMKTNVPSPFEVMAEMYHEFRSGMPVNAAGWLAVIKHLGFAICKDSVNKAWKYGEPRFQVDHAADPIPVFIVSEMNFPFLDNPPILRAEEIIGEYLSSRQIRHGILFIGPPMRLGDEETEKCLVYWGRVYSDEKWLPLILHSGSMSIEVMVKDGALIANGIDDIDVENLKDEDDGLVKVFTDNHIDPTIDLLTRDSSSKSVH